ncbi:MAG: serine/threonine protein kinase [Gemmatimonadetes bacterium]|nr:serine/threonine protein kinase [Gemmatimonadota bacterium]
MERANLRRVKRIFHEALDQPESERNGFIAATCREDGRLRADVEALLAAHDDAGEFLASPTMGDANGAQPANTAEVFDKLQRALSGRYSLERELGRGGMGIVYLARDVALDRPVAIKLLPPALATQPESRERFLREARTAAGLSHPNIVPIHLVEEQDDLVYFVMALVDGESLGDRVRRAGPMKSADAAKLVQEVAWALAYAHGRGVIHRDIKPDNILIDGGSGRALVTDFGIARVTTTGTISQQGEILGTLQYMSPEQASGDGTIDGRADLYSLGVTAFFALTGRLPFESPNPAALVAMHITEPAPPLKSVSSMVPARLAEAVDRCLAKDPAARFASGEALAEAIADSQVARREIAPSVLQFLSTTKTALAQVTALGSLGVIVATWKPTDNDPLLLSFVGLMGAASAIMPFLAARGVVRAGQDERDVAEAVASSIMARDANVEYELARTERLGKRLATVWGRAAFLLLSVPVPLLAGFILADLLEVGRILVELPAGLDGPLIAYGILRLLARLAQFLLVSAVGAFTLGMAIAPKRIITTLTRGTPERAGFLRKLWAGPVGRWFFRLSGIGLKQGKGLPVPEAAPTEVLLSRAAGELFEQLPKDQRARLGDMQDVIGGLERAAVALRARRDELATVIADVGEPESTARRGALVTELKTAKAAIEDRLATAISALENLRLDLLRLRAGVGHPDDLTAAIEEARAVGEAVDAELAARQEVESLS